MTSRILPSILLFGRGRLGAAMIHNRAAALGSNAHSRYTARPETLGYISPMDSAEITRLIESGFESATVKVLTDDNTHFQVVVVAREFDGLRSIARHQLIYKCLGTLVGNEIHALSIRALTPDELQQQMDG